MQVAQDEDARPLAETELTRLVRAAGETAYTPGNGMPKAKERGFKARSLMDIARAAPPPPPPPAPPKAQLPAAEPEAQTNIAPEAPVGNAPADLPLANAEIPHTPAQMQYTDLPKALTQPSPVPRPVPKPARDSNSAEIAKPAPPKAPPPAAAAAPVQAPAPDPKVLEAARKEAYREGQEAGRVAAEESLTQAIFTLQAAAAAFTTPAPEAMATLRAQIEHSVLALASARAGTQIDSLPGAFVRRIEALADQVQADLQRTVIRVNPDDLIAIEKTLSPAAPLALARLVGDETMARGDVELAAGGLRLTDRLGIAPADAVIDMQPQALPHPQVDGITTTTPNNVPFFQTHSSTGATGHDAATAPLPTDEAKT